MNAPDALPASPRPLVPASSLPPSPTHRRAFSFTEILFAIMILGIGFIMVAAMFPVALQQTENSTSDTIAANIARSGMNFVGQIAPTTFISNDDPTTPGQILCVLTPTIRVTGGAKNAYRLWLQAGNPTGPFLSNFPILGPPGSGLPSSQVIPGEVWPLDVTQTSPITDDKVRASNGFTFPTPPLLFPGFVWKSAAQNMIQTGNSRYAWVAFYKRDMFESISAAGAFSFSYAPYAQVIVVAVQVRNSDSFTASPVPSDLTPLTGSLEPSRYTGVSLIAPPSTGNTATIIGGVQLPGTPGNTDDRSASGAFVIISADNLPSNNPLHGLLNGHVYRLGNRFNDPGKNTWEFAPGFSLTSSDQQALIAMGGAGVNFTVYMLGMGRDTTSAATPQPFTGPAMDVAVYSSFIPCSTN